MPSYVIALIFLFFLVLSTAFELAVHALERWCAHRGRPGLAAALRKLVAELTLLGFVSLVLMTFQARCRTRRLLATSALTSLCAPYSSNAWDWTMLSQLNGCPCCLANTKGVNNDAVCGCNAEEELCSAPGDYRAKQFLGVYRVMLASLDIFSVFSERADPLHRPLTPAARCCLPNDPSTTVLEPLFANGALVANGTRRGRRLLAATPAGAAGDQEALGLPGLRTTFGYNRSDMYAEDEGVSHTHFVPEMPEFVCTGEFLNPKCAAGKMPVITAEALNQVHIWLFLIAVFHVLTAASMLALAAFRLRQWRRWQRAGGSEGGGGGTGSGDAELAGSKGAGGALEAPPPGGEAGPGGPSSAGARPAAMGGQAGAEVDGKDPEQPPPPGAQGGGTGGEGAEGAAEPRSPTRSDFSARMRRRWGRQDTIIRGKKGAAWEALFVGLRTFYPNMIAREQFQTLRHRLVRQHVAPLEQEGFDFVSYLLQCMDYDTASIAGLSYEMWAVMLLLLLLSGLLGWAGLLFLVSASALLLGTNVTLVVALRRACRGGTRGASLGAPGRAAAARGPARWWQTRRHALIKVPIRLVLFLSSFVFSDRLAEALARDPAAQLAAARERLATRPPGQLPARLRQQIAELADAIEAHLGGAGHGTGGEAAPAQGGKSAAGDPADAPSASEAGRCCSVPLEAAAASGRAHRHRERRHRGGPGPPAWRLLLASDAGFGTMCAALWASSSVKIARTYNTPAFIAQAAAATLAMLVLGAAWPLAHRPSYARWRVPTLAGVQLLVSCLPVNWSREVLDAIAPGLAPDTNRWLGCLSLFAQLLMSELTGGSGGCRIITLVLGPVGCRIPFRVQAPLQLAKVALLLRLAVHPFCGSKFLTRPDIEAGFEGAHAVMAALAGPLVGPEAALLIPPAGAYARKVAVLLMLWALAGWLLPTLVLVPRSRRHKGGFEGGGEGGDALSAGRAARLADRLAVALESWLRRLRRPRLSRRGAPGAAVFAVRWWVLLLTVWGTCCAVAPLYTPPPI
eukprot:scaffold12.g7912.t1